MSDLFSSFTGSAAGQGIGGKSRWVPSQEYRNLAAQKQALMAQMIPQKPGSFGMFAIAQHLAQKKAANADKNQQDVLARAMRSVMREGGDKPLNGQEAIIAAHYRAADEFAMQGQSALANEMMMKAATMEQTFLNQQLENNKLRAEAEAKLRETDTRTGYVKNLDERDTTAGLYQQGLADGLDPDSQYMKTLSGRLDDLNAMILKDHTITGRTEFDDGMNPRERTLGMLQEKMVANQVAEDQLTQALATFDPEMWTLWGRWKGDFIKLADIAGLPISKEDKAFLWEQTYQMQKIQQFGLDYIRAQTGAQMSDAEAKRIKAAIPNEDDGPEVLYNKMRMMRNWMAALNARTNLALETGSIEVLDRPIDDFFPEDPLKMNPYKDYEPTLDEQTSDFLSSLETP